MEMLKIEGGKPLSGEVCISGNKNSALPILASSILYCKKSLIKNLPSLADTKFLLELLKSFGLKIEHLGSNSIEIDASIITSTKADYEMVRKMRASILVLAPLLVRTGNAIVSLPGGCAIGSRPVDIHLEGLKALGADLEVKEGYIHAKLKGNSFVGATIDLPLPSVGATEQLIMAAVLAKGDTIINKAAKEPEVCELISTLNSAGAKISGAGSSTLHITGVTSLCSLNHQILFDRIEAGTFIALAAGTKSEIVLNNIVLSYMENIINVFKKAGCEFLELGSNSIKVKGPELLQTIDMETAPYPGFPTDMQAQFMAAMTTANGISNIYERIFENRMMHVPELIRMGADIEVHKGIARVKGKKNLVGAQVMATDLRASASLVIAALMAQGKSEIRRIYHLDRGYDSLDEKLLSLSAHITRCKQS